MIKCENGKVNVKGEKTEIKAELCSLINSLYSTKALTYNEVMELVILGLLSDKKLNNKIKE